MFNRSKGSVNNLVATKEYAAVFVTLLTHKMHCRQALRWEISSERDGTKKMMKNLNIIQISHLTFECS